LAILLSFALAGAGASLGLALAPWAYGQAAPVTPKMQAPAEARVLSRAFATVAKAMRPSVVRIDVETEQPRAQRQAPRDRRAIPPELKDLFERFFDFDFENTPFPSPGPGKGTGSGVLLDESGHILTNGHVVSKATKLTVTLADGRELPAKLVGADEQTDVAVVRIDRPPSGLMRARFGDSDRVEIGEWVLAIGSPLGLDQSVTAGIVSSKGKVGRNVQSFAAANKVREYIQTDAMINPGNSGGPLVNLDGEVIGINTVINVGPGGAYGFAIPVNQARRVADVLIKEGKVRYAFLGVGLYPLDDLPAERREALKNLPDKAAVVRNVVPRSPAAESGIRAGDVITKIDTEVIQGPQDVISYISSKPIGARVTVSYVRDGKPASVQVRLGELPSNEELSSLGARPSAEPSAAGAHLQDLTPELSRFLGMPADSKGAVVTEVEAGSRAAKAGLRAEDVIVEVNRKPVSTAAEAAAALREAKGAVVLRIRSGRGPARFITIPAP
jgi:serine protease Do